MLRFGAGGVAVEPDGRGAPNASPDEWKRRCRAGATANWGRLKWEPAFSCCSEMANRAILLSEARPRARDLENAG